MAFFLHNKEQNPRLAILTVKDSNRIFRGNLHNFLDLIQTGERLGVDVYVVTTKDFNLSGNEIHGYRYNNQTKKWSRELVPAPQVVYNRIPYRKMEMKPEVQQTIQACNRSSSVHLFNSSFFNKWTLFSWLNGAKDSKPYMPDTKQLSSADDLTSLLRKHAVLYLKPVKGKAGKGIMRIDRITTKGSQTQYRLSRQVDKQMTYSVHNTTSELWNEWNRHRGSNEYIAQQGIALARYKQRAYDLRALIQKTSKGEWSVSGIGARVAGKASITTHVPRGGSIDDPFKLLSQGFGPKEAKSILKRVETAAVTLATQIEKSSGNQLGEMSMDIGVDVGGHIWFFEANSKPMKFDEPKIRKKSLERIIRYSLYLINNGRRR
ncbi:YheC/YheD family protein [Paenibacillus chondroitinus]|uniref:YheC/YheD family protein n=1 Tax=Paenibacillus chondroitinus TaxID=59842 RepID=A0ABU6DJ93_9BACL|nr:MULTISPECIES: YheC/YheD family protein [Paenibacillus]MCY9663261.1 YheC/YheD family protein [Paenibacillus anseongense]MEB4797058.1 YheC/YheD family protein [Paenibacillus chondroitinus]